MSNSIQIQQIMQSMKEVYQQVVNYILDTASKIFAASEVTRVYVFVSVPVNK